MNAKAAHPGQSASAMHPQSASKDLVRDIFDRFWNSLPVSMENTMKRVLPALLLFVACVHRGPQGPMTIPLRSTLSAEDMRDQIPAAAVDDLNRQVLEVGSFVDARPERGLVGKNVEKGGGGTVSTGDDVGTFVQDQLVKIFGANGIKLGAGATRVLTGEVQRFFVTEENTYDTDVAIKFRLADSSGRELWQGVGEGHSHRFGRSFSADNYQEALSSALFEAVKDLLANPDFRKNFRG